MKKLIILVGVVLFYVACTKNKQPDGVIAKDKMINVMLDMQLADGYLSQIYSQDTMLMQANSRYNYVFKKYNIDSAKFTHSLKHYSLTPTELDEMYTVVFDSLVHLKAIMEPITARSEDMRPRAQDTYAYVFKNFTTNQPKFTNTNYYTLDAKKLYGKFIQSSDTTKRIKDSLELRIPGAEESEKLKIEKSTKNDLSAE